MTKAEITRRYINATMKLELEGWHEAPKKTKDAYARAFIIAGRKLSRAELEKAKTFGKKAAK